MDRIELSLEPRLGVPLAASKMTSEPKVLLAQTVQLSCLDTNTVSDRTKTKFHMPRRLVVPSGAYKMIFKPLVRSTQTVHLSCVKISAISEQTESSFYLSLVT
jgi:hypothetical protein